MTNESTDSGVRRLVGRVLGAAIIVAAVMAIAVTLLR
jgi:hypothetical protein